MNSTPRLRSTLEHYISALLCTPLSLGVYHTAHPAHDVTIHTVVVSITPTQAFYDALWRLKPELAFLHRPFTLDHRRVPRGVEIFASHQGFDEVATTGWNLELARRLGVLVGELSGEGALQLRRRADAEREWLSELQTEVARLQQDSDDEDGEEEEDDDDYDSDGRRQRKNSTNTEQLHALLPLLLPQPLEPEESAHLACMKGYKASPTRRIGLVGTLAATPSPPPLHTVLARITAEFPPDAVSSPPSPPLLLCPESTPVTTLAILNAFNPQIVRRVGSWLPSAARCVLVTGEPRQSGLDVCARDPRIAAVVAVGHAACEAWGVRWLADAIDGWGAGAVRVGALSEDGDDMRLAETPRVQERGRDSMVDKEDEAGGVNGTDRVESGLDELDIFGGVDEADEDGATRWEVALGREWDNWEDGPAAWQNKEDKDFVDLLQRAINSA